MRLGLLLDAVDVKRFVGFEDQVIDSIHYDSRTVTPGGLFVAIHGHRYDGTVFIEKAIKKGAVAILTEDQWSVPPSISVAQVENCRLALAALSSAFYRDPSRELVMIGITGTNGKTTTAYFIESVLNCAGSKVGVIGTINYRFGGQSYTNPVTTPESLDLMRLLRKMVDSGTTHVVLEVSSHALDLHRVAFCGFDVGVFTNLSRDHLDYHPDMETYWQCKKDLCVGRLGTGSKRGQAAAVINWDDPRGKELFTEVSVPCLRVGLSDECEVQAQDINVTTGGISGRVKTPEGGFDFTSSLVGIHNVYNMLSATGVAIALEIPPVTIQKGIEDLQGVPGRLESVDNDLGLLVFVDYAHTPDALENVLTVLRGLTSGRMITIFGCGGDRDREKRPLMGATAGRLSDLVVLTSDNPRTESPEAILADIVKGTAAVRSHDLAPNELANGFEPRGYIVEPDRRKAIKLGLGAAKSGDTVLIAGKGHETYQIIGEASLPFDDRVEARKALGEIVRGSKE
ncbi:MAG: UDP-N-acetylmuramoyl-L-alanyl-D-glutamate--2,6-diaminopimelate ligase [Desulfobacterales bacterium C00003060]|nr:MAG: UDP-N-acetylmuramoyl-L-alanyl-D-glutamate--2,6-diaminopimelate ligase [Desulfobacterales bacterium C00003060]OEU83490.1 MAG: UDP-N-acetylmuramoyl-L-alanyl-D-glutamate--2,6-diaminopimelate ligase [Desulfobacterales bacterium S5133MH4]